MIADRFPGKRRKCCRTYYRLTGNRLKDNSHPMKALLLLSTLAASVCQFDGCQKSYSEISDLIYTINQYGQSGCKNDSICKYDLRCGGTNDQVDSRARKCGEIIYVESPRGEVNRMISPLKCEIPSDSCYVFKVCNDLRNTVTPAKSAMVKSARDVIMVSIPMK